MHYNVDTTTGNDCSCLNFAEWLDQIDIDTCKTSASLYKGKQSTRRGFSCLIIIYANVKLNGEAFCKYISQHWEVPGFEANVQKYKGSDS
jgi:hypothetical protein